MEKDLLLIESEDFTIMQRFHNHRESFTVAFS